jgi:ParB-like chromosome segregation protein Spo0J
MNTFPIAEKEILRDFFFRFSSPADLSALARSIRESGIWNPIRVLPAEQGFRILAGFRRFQASLEAGLETIPCRVLSEAVPPERHFEEVLLEQASGRILHLFEKARALRIGRGLGMEDGELRRRFAPVLGLSDSSEALEETLALLDLDPALQAYLERHPLSLKQAAPFREIDPRDQALMAEIGVSLQMRVVELTEILQALLGISRGEGAALTTVWETAGAAVPARTPDLNRNEKIRNIKEALKRRRTPTVVSVNESLDRVRQNMDHMAGIRLEWDPSLEQAGLSLGCRIRSEQDLDNLVRFLSLPANRERFRAMFGLV